MSSTLVAIGRTGYRICIDPVRVSLIEVNPRTKSEVPSNCIIFAEAPKADWVVGTFVEGRGSARIRSFVKAMFPLDEQGQERETAWSGIGKIITDYLATNSVEHSVLCNGHRANLTGTNLGFRISVVRTSTGEEVDYYRHNGLPEPHLICEEGVRVFLNKYGFSTQDFREPFRAYCKRVQPTVF